MGRKRKQNQIPVVAKKSKLTPDEYTAEFTRKVDTRQNEEPVRISKYYFNKAVEKICNYGVKKKRKHPMKDRYGDRGVRCLNSCNSSSMDALNRSLLQPIVYTPTWTLLVKMLRKALLAHNWSYCLRLYDALLKYSALRRRHLLYLLRLTFLLLFNLKVSKEKLNNFLTVTMSIRGTAEQTNFLWSLIELKKFPDKYKSSETDDVPSKDENIPSDEDVISPEEDAIPPENVICIVDED